MKQSTTNYDMFKKRKINRKVEQVHVDKLARAISLVNLLEFNPITVNQGFEVFDGQHRLEAARSLGVPVFYQVSDDIKDEDIIMLNNNVRAWSLENYLDYYVQKDERNYVLLKRFMEKNNLGLRNALIISGDRVYNRGPCRKVNKKKGVNELTGYPQFKAGGFKFPDEEKLQKIMTTLDGVRAVADMVRRKTLGSNIYLESNGFINGLVQFLSAEVVDFTTFMDKLERRMDFMRPCSTSTLYLKMFQDIYNYKNREPIDL